jgi:hypothetical protein
MQPRSRGHPSLRAPLAGAVVASAREERSRGREHFLRNAVALTGKFAQALEQGVVVIGWRCWRMFGITH